MSCSQWSRWDEKELVQWERSCHHARLIFVVFLLKTLDRFFDFPHAIANPPTAPSQPQPNQYEAIVLPEVDAWTWLAMENGVLSTDVRPSMAPSR